MNIKVLDIGLSHYLECYALQKKILNDIKSNGAPEHIIITEHYPVFTIGRAGKKDNILVSKEFLKEKGVEVVETDRGGDVTYHCPGQLVVYPIVKVADLHKYLRCLEEAVIQLLREYDIDGFRVEGKTGVWTSKGKIASIGIGVSRWITYHGVALNVNCDLTPFSWINPCGFKDTKITSMGKMGAVPKKETNTIFKERVKCKLIESFCGDGWPAEPKALPRASEAEHGKVARQTGPVAE
ncbi:MAG: lipoyl(octanoyl) transferase LipB [Candidatus Omnitrophica bacterium]|nr:lipoyl(octanoyl) transferase LipB [Candidatus Omnitrophota bacterium]